jgi:hypothetical protein
MHLPAHLGLLLQADSNQSRCCANTSALPQRAVRFPHFVCVFFFFSFGFFVLSHWVHVANAEGLNLPALNCASHGSFLYIRLLSNSFTTCASLPSNLCVVLQAACAHPSDHSDCIRLQSNSFATCFCSSLPVRCAAKLPVCTKALISPFLLPHMCFFNFV